MQPEGPEGPDRFDMPEPDSPLFESVRFKSLQMTNFLSYKTGSLDFGTFVALVGPNASGKSNAVAAIKLLHEISVYGLPVALARRGGFDQLRHRSAGRPYDPALRLSFEVVRGEESYYELKLGAVQGGRYRVKSEEGMIRLGGQTLGFISNGDVVIWQDSGDSDGSTQYRIAPGQSALTSSGIAPYAVSSVLRSIQTVELNPAKISDLQEPSSTREFESDGSNAVSYFENLDPQQRRDLADELATIVPNIESIAPYRVADKMTLRFRQRTEKGVREFFAKQMSDGTLRALAILLAASQPTTNALVVIEEPEVAIHLGALRTLIELLRARAGRTQVMITTHSADIVDALPMEDLRIVWSEADASHIAPVSAHSMEPVIRGLITPGELLRSDSLDPQI